MRIHYIIHAAFEKLGAIREWAESRGHQLHETNTFKGEALPRNIDFDCLLVLGGTQSALQIERYPYLQDEVAFISRVIAKDIPVVGICLGAQLISLAGGAAVEKSPLPEIGHFPIQLTEHANDDVNFKDFPSELCAMHWHSDMPGLTNNAVILAKSAACPRQIIRFQQNVYGFQCHLELTWHATKSLIESCPEQLIHQEFIQPADKILAADFVTPNRYMNAFFDRLLKGY